MPAALCSTGEQKALLISIVLADARLRAAERGAPPILLLDEIAAHLDAVRRAALFEEICALGAQAWLTGTDRSEEHTSELQSLMRISFAVFCLKQKKRKKRTSQRTRRRL